MNNDISDTDSIVAQILGPEIDDSAFFKLAEGNDDDFGFSFNLLFNTFLEEQIEDGLTNSNVEEKQKDFLAIISAKLAYLVEKMITEDDDPTELKAAYRDMLEETMNKLETKFSFDSSLGTEATPDAIPFQTLEGKTLGLYTFLVVERISNTIIFLSSYIYKNRKTIVKRLKLRPNKSGSSNFVEAGDTALIDNLDEVITEISSAACNFEEFVRAIETQNEGDISLEALADSIDAEDIDFVRNFLRPVSVSTQIRRAVIGRIKSSLIETLPQNKEE